MPLHVFGALQQVLQEFVCLLFNEWMDAFHLGACTNELVYKTAIFAQTITITLEDQRILPSDHFSAEHQGWPVRID